MENKEIARIALILKRNGVPVAKIAAYFREKYGITNAGERIEQFALSIKK